jgi:L-fuconolactonase
VVVLHDRVVTRIHYVGRVVIDAHQHLWDPQRHTYDWLLRPGNEPILRTFTMQDVLPLASTAGVDRAVLVQADDHWADTEAMFEAAGAHDEVAGVVAWVPLDRPGDAAPMLDELQSRQKFAGIRNLIHDQPDPDWLLRPGVGEGLALLEQRDVPFDIVAVLPRHLEHVPVLSRRYPRLRMVLDHLGHPPLDGGSWQPWRSLIERAAQNPLVSAKISGLYPTGSGWDFRPLIEFALETFGPDRLMFGSDWPVAELFGGYEHVTGSLLRVIRELSAHEQAAILGETAQSIYRLRGPART